MAVLLTSLLILVSAGAATANTETAPGQVAKTKVIIRYKTKPGKAEKARLRKENKAEIRFAYRNVKAIAAKVPPGQLKAIRKRKNVEAIEPDHRISLTDAELDASWGVKHIGAGDVHATGNRGAGVRVAVIDTGIDCGHPDLDAHCDPGINYVASAPTAFDDHGHGRHVAGIIAAEDNGVGVVGVAPSATVVAMKVLDASGSGDYGGLIAALDDITTWNSVGPIADRIHVVNMSLGGHDVSATLEEAVARASASGAMLVGASGNTVTLWEIIFGCPVVYPAAYPSVFAVTHTNGDDALTGSSCTGPEVDFGAPGDYVNSTVPASGSISSPTGCAQASGTSMASPHVAGTVALMRSAGVNSLGEVRSQLCETAATGFGVLTTPIPPSDPRYAEYFGCGVIDAGAALAGGGTTPPPGDTTPPTLSVPADIDVDEDGAGDGEVVDFVVTATDDQDPAPLVVCTPASGSTFAVGTTPVDCTATDAAGNEASDGFSVTVRDVTPPVLALPEPISVADAEGDGEVVTFSASATDTVDPDPLVVCTPASGSTFYEGITSVGCTATDAAGNEASGSFDVTVSVPPPAVEIHTFVATEDAHVGQRRPTRNYDTAKRLYVNDGGYLAFVRFDVTGITGTVMTATLRMHALDGGGTGAAYSVAGSWSEDAVTYESRPDLGGAIDDSLSTVSSGGTADFDVSSVVAGNGSFDFAIADGSDDLVKYSSREGSLPPELVLEVLPPASATSVFSAPSELAEPAEPKTKPKPKADPKSKGDPKLKTDPQPKPKSKRGPRADPRPEVEAPPELKSKPKPKTKQKSKTAPRAKAKPWAEPRPDVDPKAKTEPKPKAVGAATYALGDNPLGVETASLTLKPKPKARLELLMSDGTTLEYTVKTEKRGGGPKAKPNVPPVALGESRPDGSYRLSFDLPAPGGDVAIRMVFEAEQVTMKWLGQSVEGELVE